MIDRISHLFITILPEQQDGITFTGFKYSLIPLKIKVVKLSCNGIHVSNSI